MEVTVRALLRAAHMKRQDMVFQYLSDQEALSAVASGRVDAALVMGGLPDKEINEALAGGALRLIPLEGAAFEELAERTGLYLPTTIKLGTYPYMEGPVSTLSVPVLLVGTSSLPKERTLALRSLLQMGWGRSKSDVSLLSFPNQTLFTPSGIPFPESWESSEKKNPGESSQ